MRWIALLLLLVGPAQAQYAKTPGELISPIKIILALTNDERETMTRALYDNDSHLGVAGFDVLTARNHRIRDELIDPVYFYMQLQTFPGNIGVTTWLFSRFLVYSNPSYLVLRTGAMGLLASGVPVIRKPVMTGDDCGVIGHIKEHLGMEKCRWEAPLPIEFTIPEIARASHAVSNDRYHRWQDRIEIPALVADASGEVPTHERVTQEMLDALPQSVKDAGQLQDGIWNSKAIALYDHLTYFVTKPKQVAQITKQPPLGPDAQFLTVTTSAAGNNPAHEAHRVGPMSPADCAAEATKQIAAGNTATCQAVLTK